MTEADAIRAYKEELPVEEITPNASTLTRRRYEKPMAISYMKTEALLTQIYLTFKVGERAISTYAIEKLRLCETTEGEKTLPTNPFKYETEGANAV